VTSWGKLTALRIEFEKGGRSGQYRLDRLIMTRSRPTARASKTGAVPGSVQSGVIPQLIEELKTMTATLVPPTPEGEDSKARLWRRLGLERAISIVERHRTGQGRRALTG
jgi:hypothetical protein